MGTVGIVTRMGTLRTRRMGRPGVVAFVLFGWTLLVVAMVPVPVGAAARAIGQSSSTVWLCQPGQVGDPCAYSPEATSVAVDGTTSRPASVAAPVAHKFDCFYVYPTSSTEPGNNADLRVQPVEREVAVVQASRFSQVCNVWAPMYRQATVVALKRGAAVEPSVIATAYDSLLAAWKDYLAHDNHGRPIVFIGHSQGAAMLIKLLQAQIDPSASLRKRMVSAIILGGNVQVPTGRDEGGSFRSIPTCGSSSQTGCVIAYSSFGSPPPADSFFARPGQGVSLQSGQTTQVGPGGGLCQPGDVLVAQGPAAALLPQRHLRSAARHGEHTLGDVPGPLYGPVRAERRCVLVAGHRRLPHRATCGPRSRPPSGPLWGYHLQDVNLALGNLVSRRGERGSGLSLSRRRSAPPAPREPFR